MHCTRWGWTLATANDMNRNVLCTSNPEVAAAAQGLRVGEKDLRASAAAYPRCPCRVLAGSEKGRHYRRRADRQTYLPRKFKTTVVIPPRERYRLHANDANFVAIAENGKLVGFNLLVGGGLSIEHGNKKTYARTASEFGWRQLTCFLAVAEAVVTTSATGATVPTVRMRKPSTPLSASVVRERLQAEVERRAEH